MESKSVNPWVAYVKKVASLLRQDVYTHLSQSQVEIKHYSVAYFDRIAVFEAL